MIQKFGDHEYSLLSALSSQSKLTRINSLDALLKPEMGKKLTVNEKDLVKLTLSQILTRLSEEEAVFEKTFNAYVSLIDPGSSCDSEYDMMEDLANALSQTKKYAYEILRQVITAACRLKVTEDRQLKQLLLGLCFDTITHIPDTFKTLRTPGKSQKAADILGRLQQNPEAGKAILLGFIASGKAWVNPEIV